MALQEVMHLDRHPEDGRHRFDYTGMHRYLITLTAHLSQPVFREQPQVVKVLSALRASCDACRFDVYAYCFLPDRLVMLVRGKTEGSSMKEFLSSFRAASADALREDLGRELWARKYTERVLRKGEDSREVASKIFRLPVVAGLAPTPEAYPLQGSFVIDVNAPQSPTRRRPPSRRSPRR
jgi:putative transposase